MNDDASTLTCHHCQTAFSRSDNDLACPSCGEVPEYAGVQGAYESKQHGGSPHLAFAHFELIEKLGSGGFGTVWRAKNKKLDRWVAVKLPRRGALDEKELNQFQREACAAAQIRHPNIVSVHEFGQHDDLVYIVSDLVEGTTLEHHLKSNQLSARQAAQLCVRISDALDHAHDAGVVHRDLKPSNIMLDSNLHPHVMDFGLAKRFSEDITITQDGQVLGTPAYMSPEQATGRGSDSDRRTDVYSLGVILYELLTGAVPFRGSPRLLMHKIIHDEVPQLRKLSGQVPRDLETICLKCLNKTPDRRYQSAGELKEDLERWIDGRPIQASPTSRAEYFIRWCTRNPVTAGLCGALLVLLITGLSLVSWQWYRAETHLANFKSEFERAQGHLARTEKTVDKMLDDFAETLRNSPNSEPLTLRMLEDAVSLQQEILKVEGDNPDTRIRTARAKRRLAEFLFLLGRYQNAIETLDRGIAILERDIDESKSADSTIELVRQYRLAGEIQLQALQPGLAKIALRKAYDTLQSYSWERGNPEYLLESAAVHNHLGRYSPVESPNEFECYEIALSNLDSIPPELQVQGAYQKIKLYSNMARRSDLNGHVEKAEAFLLDSISISEKYIAQFPERIDFQESKAASYVALGNIWRRADEADLDRSAVNLKAGYEAYAELADSYPNTPRFVEREAYACLMLVRTYRAQEKLDLAQEYFELTAAAAEHLSSRFPDLEDTKLYSARRFYVQGLLETSLGNDAAALEAYQRAVDSRSEMIAEGGPFTQTYRLRWAISQYRIGEIHASNGRIDEAIEYFQLAHEVTKNLIQKQPNYRNYVHNHLVVCRLLSDAELRNDNFSEAARYVDEFLAVHHLDPIQKNIDGAELFADCANAAYLRADALGEDLSEFVESCRLRSVACAQQALEAGLEDREKLKHLANYQCMHTYMPMQALFDN